MILFGAVACERRRFAYDTCWSASVGSLLMLKAFGDTELLYGSAGWPVGRKLLLPTKMCRGPSFHLTPEWISFLAQQKTGFHPFTRART
jgi:hypothetical protein